VDEEFRRWADERDREQREFLDALTERHVGITQQLIEAMHAGFDRLAAQISLSSDRITSSLAELQAEIADQREQIQANTQALLRVLDRLEPGQN
jgi:hypothetical protein